MATSYTDQLAKWIIEKKSPSRNKNLVAFLAVKSDIKEALDAGYSVKTVWANMHELKRIDVGYDAFLNYVNRHIRKPLGHPLVSQTEPNSSAHEKECESTPDEEHNPKKNKHGTISGFKFNPIPNAKELF